MNHRILWGKTAAADRYHPLLCHMLDVGSVGEALLSSPAARHMVRALGRLMGVDEAMVPKIVPCLVALHDVGKASPSFERKSERHWRRVLAAGFADAVKPQPRFDHALEARLVLRDVIERAGLLAADGRRGQRALDAIVHGIAAHHGRFFAPGPTAEVPHDERDLPEPWHDAWREARYGLAGELRRVFLEGIPAVLSAPTNLSALCAFLSGLTVLCDWIGSDQAIFEPYDDGDLDRYAGIARERARQALDARRLLSYLPAPANQPTFGDLFEFAPRPLQAAVEPAALDLPGQALVVIEAPTGEGKTEAAFLLARRLAATGEVDGFYFALPTMATSNQMFHRMRRDLGRQLRAGEEANLLLVHGLSEFSAELAELLEHAKHEGLEPDERVVADSWLLPRKRSLVTPYGVGTVDQAMLAALNVRFGSLRLFGLAGKVLIVDEVHAYDLYMSTILQQLLRWLGALGASVVLLSATLPRARRDELVAAFQGRTPADAPPPTRQDPYPLITVAGGPATAFEPRAVEIEAASPRTVCIGRRRDGADARLENARFLLGEIAQGGCACWLCNTVGEAQECFLALEEAAKELSGEAPRLMLFHARFPQAWRSGIEAEVVAAFGPEGDRPRKAVLVATQVVEQSLDLDFDLMMTQLAPVDLLVQRMGRVHRHAREGRVGQPRLVLLEPAVTATGAPDFGAYRRVYQPYVLLRTLGALKGRDRVEVPSEIRPLIEAVYDEAVPHEALIAAGFAASSVAEARRQLEQERARMRDEARIRLLQAPDQAGLFASNPGIEYRDEDAAESQEWIAMQTRLADPSVRAILLDGGHPLIRGLTSSQRPRLATAELVELLDRSVTIASAPLFRHVTDGAPADKVYPLDHVRGMKGRHLIVLTDGSYAWSADATRNRLVLTRKLGVQIVTEASR